MPGILLGLSVNVVASAQQAKTEEICLEPFPVDHVADRALLKKLGYTFRPHRTPHFSIISDADARRVKQLEETAEQTLSDVCVFADKLGGSILKPPNKMSVVFFDKWSDYHRHAREFGFHVNQSMPGFFADRLNRCLIFNYANANLIRTKRHELLVASMELKAVERNTKPIDKSASAMVQRKRRKIQDIEFQIRTQERLITMTVVRHEIAHQLLSNMGLQPIEAGNGRWLREGLAMQFENRHSINKHRLDDFLASCPSATNLNLHALIGDPRHIGPGAEDLTTRYAQAWALVHYLSNERPNAFRKYLRSIVENAERGPPTSSTLAMFESAFGKVDPTFERGLFEYIRNLRPAP